MKELKLILEKSSFDELTELAKYLKVENGDIYDIRNKFKENNHLLIDKIIEYLQYASKSIVDKVFEPNLEVPYRRILKNILDRFTVVYNDKLPVEELEKKVLYYFFDYIDKFSDEQKKEIILNLNNKDIEKIIDKVSESNILYLFDAIGVGGILFLINTITEQFGENYSKVIPSIIFFIKLKYKYQ